MTFRGADHLVSAEHALGSKDRSIAVAVQVESLGVFAEAGCKCICEPSDGSVFPAANPVFVSRARAAVYKDPQWNGPIEDSDRFLQ